MTITEFESLPDRAEAVMTAMRPVEIEIVEAQFTSCIGRPHPWSDKQLHRLRVLALQSAQLWRVCLPQESAAISYTPEGLVNESARGTELSISG